MNWWYRFNQCGLQVLFAAFFNVRVLNRENVPRHGPVLLVSNHQSFLDPPLCGVGLQRELDYIARDSLFRNPCFAWLIRSLNAIPIRRGQADTATIRTIIRRLQDRRAIVLFPEATRTGDGTISAIKSGFELIARKTRATTVPVVIDGAFEVWPRTQLLPRLGRITVMYGKPIHWERMGNLPREAFVKEVQQQLRTMQHEVRRRYGKKPYD